MRKYFQIYNFSNELNDQMAVYNLNRKSYIWWNDINKVGGIKEIYITWKTFKKIFKRKYLSEQYYEEKEKGFMNQGQDI